MALDVSGDQIFDLGLDTLDITSETIDFDEIDELITTFQNDDRVREALEKGVDLREYSRQIESDLRDVEKSSIDDYIKESNNLAYLHTQIRSCDTILETMESLLTGFQADLGNISDEIKYLQDQSSTMSIKLKNRKTVGSKLSSFIDDIIIPPSLVKNICENEVNDSYLEYLLQLNKKMSFVQECQTSRKIASVKDVGPDLDRLRMKAVSKIREFILRKIDSFRKPNTNVQTLQQPLLKFKYFFVFLSENAKEVATEIKQYYQETLSKIVLNNCKNYLTALLKLQVEIGTKNDLLATPESALKGFFSDRFQKDKANVFSLGEPSRAALIDNLEEDALVPHVAAEKNLKFPFEVLFRSYNRYLMDFITSEHIFQSDFFSSSSTAIYDAVFARPALSFLESLQAFLVNSYDSIGMLIMIKMTDIFAQTMRQRGITCLNNYFEMAHNMLAPRMAAVVSLHVDSLRNATAKSLGSVDIRAHYVTRRFAEYITAILSLNVHDRKVNVLTEQLQSQMDALLARLAKEQQDEKKRVLFIINNIDQILSVLHERDVHGEVVEKIKQSLADARKSFVDIELKMYFKTIVAYVDEFNAVLTSPTPDSIPVDRGITEKLASDFAQNYKQLIDDINKDVMTFFSNFKTGAQILQETLTKLATVYETFTEIVKKRFKAAPFLKDLVAPNTLTWQIKKYNINFD